MKTLQLFTLVWLVCSVQTFAQTNISVDGSPALRKAISPYIYGLNPYHWSPTETGMALHDQGINVTSFRFGGDAVSTYNWENNSNTSWDQSCGAPYNTNSNNKFLASASGLSSAQFNTKAGAALKTVTDANASNNAYPLIQAVAMGMVAADNGGCITAAQCGDAASGRFKTTVIEKPGPLSMDPDMNDANVYVDEGINYMMNTAGKSDTQNGIKGWCLENEPGIWNSTHPCNHPQRPTCAGLIAKNRDVALRIKALDPTAETFGPGAYGFTEYRFFNINGNWGNPNYFPSDWPTYNMSDVPGYNETDYGYLTWIASYLRRMNMESETAGKRLLDVLDIHYYATYPYVLTQDSRSFWDDTYVEDSWITQHVTNNMPIKLADYMQKAITDFYPGTKFAVTEWGNFNSPGADAGIYIADMLGAFGMKDVYLATYFGRLKAFASGAYRIFTNYDGNNAAFGNTFINTSSSDNAKITAYASISDADTDKMHLVLINRSNAVENANVSVANAGNYINAEVYAMLGNAGGAIAQQTGLNTISNNGFSFALQPRSVYHFVLKTATLAASNVERDSDTVIYPNPSSGEFSVKTHKKIESAHYYDGAGRIFTLRISNNTFHIKETGSWFVKINFTDGSEILKTVIVK